MPREALEIVPLAQETGNIAYSLVTGKGYSSPFRSNTGPTAWLPPVYPLLIAGIFLICGPLSMASLNASVLLNILCSAGTCIPIFFIGKRVGGVTLAATAAWLWAIFPNAIMLPYEWIWDTSMSALLAAFLLWARSLLVAGYHQITQSLVRVRRVLGLLSVDQTPRSSAPSAPPVSRVGRLPRRQTRRIIFAKNSAHISFLAAPRSRRRHRHSLLRSLDRAQLHPLSQIHPGALKLRL